MGNNSIKSSKRDGDSIGPVIPESKSKNSFSSKLARASTRIKANKRDKLIKVSPIDKNLPKTVRTDGYEFNSDENSVNNEGLLISSKDSSNDAKELPNNTKDLPISNDDSATNTKDFNSSSCEQPGTSKSATAVQSNKPPLSKTSKLWKISRAKLKHSLSGEGSPHATNDDCDGHHSQVSRNKNGSDV